MLDFSFASSAEICALLGQRIKTHRLHRQILQADLAQRAGISRGTLQALENVGHATLDTLVRVTQALGLQDEIAPLFILKVQSIAQMEQRAAALGRQRARQRTPKVPKA